MAAAGGGAAGAEIASIRSVTPVMSVMEGSYESNLVSISEWIDVQNYITAFSNDRNAITSLLSLLLEHIKRDDPLSITQERSRLGEVAELLIMLHLLEQNDSAMPSIAPVFHNYVERYKKSLGASTPAWVEMQRQLSLGGIVVDGAGEEISTLSSGT